MQEFDGPHFKESAAKPDLALISPAGVYFNPDTLQIFAPSNLAPDVRREELVCSKPEAHPSEPRSKGTCGCADVPRLRPTGRPVLSRLTLHVSNTCNLGCTYCYASGGDYGLGRKLMTSDSAIGLLAQAFEAFHIETLMFFGGEPSLNVDVITDCCLFVKELLDRKIIKCMPRFGVISNMAGVGPRFDRFLAVCKIFDISVTVSVDGPKAIHDSNRPTLKGGGSYEILKKNYFAAQKLGIPLQIECTYTKKHVELGLSVLDLMKFFKSEFGVAHSHIAPASCAPSSSETPAQTAIIDAYCEAIKYMIDTLDTPDYLSINIGEGLIKALVNRERIDHYCPAGNSELTIGPDGKLSPCFMFVGHEPFDMGGIQTGNRWLSEKGEAILELIRRNGKKEHPICRDCWARNVCSGCIGADYLETSSMSDRPKCKFIMSTAAETIVRLAEVAQGLPVGAYGYDHRHKRNVAV
jgi:uncharacterized protein